LDVTSVVDPDGSGLFAGFGFGFFDPDPAVDLTWYEELKEIKCKT